MSGLRVFLVALPARSRGAASAPSSCRQYIVRVFHRQRYGFSRAPRPSSGDFHLRNEPGQIPRRVHESLWKSTPSCYTSACVPRRASMNSAPARLLAVLPAIALLSSLAHAQSVKMAPGPEFESVADPQTLHVPAEPSLVVDLGALVLDDDVLEQIARSSPSLIGVHRPVPIEHSGDLVPRLVWNSGDGGPARAVFEVRSEAASSIRVRIAAELPEGAFVTTYDGEGIASRSLERIRHRDGRGRWRLASGAVGGSDPGRDLASVAVARRIVPGPAELGGPSIQRVRELPASGGAFSSLEPGVAFRSRALPPWLSPPPVPWPARLRLRTLEF